MRRAVTTLLLAVGIVSPLAAQPAATSPLASQGLEFIDTRFENASPLWYEVDGEVIRILEQLLRKHTWFTEGSTNTAFRNSGTLGDGWLQRYGIDAVVHEFNCNWIAGLNDYPSAAHWITYGETLAAVLHDYFVRVKL